MTTAFEAVQRYINPVCRFQIHSSALLQLQHLKCSQYVLPPLSRHYSRSPHLCDRHAHTPTSGGSGGSCSTGPIQCCQSTETVSDTLQGACPDSDIRKPQAGSAAGTAQLKSLGVVVQDVNAVLGLDCSPISMVGVGGGSACSVHPVCCKNNSFVSVLSTVLVVLLTYDGSLYRAALFPSAVSWYLCEELCASTKWRLMNGDRAIMLQDYAPIKPCVILPRATTLKQPMSLDDRMDI